MKNKARLHLLLIVLTFGAFILFLPRYFSSQAVNHSGLRERIIVRFKQGSSDFDKFKIRQLIGAIFSEAIDKLNVQVFELPFPLAEKALEMLQKNNLVQYAEKDQLAYAFESANDPYLTDQWGLAKIMAADSAESAWDYSKSNSSVLVAIVDTGIDQNHSDLNGKIAKNKNCTSSRTVDDRYGHGTHVAGIAAAVTNNNLGVAATGYNARLLNAKGLGDNGSGYYSWIANCIIWSADNGASVINLSLGGSSSSQTLLDAVNYAWSKGVVVVAAAGNSGVSTPSYPAYYDNAIAVAATDSNDQKASWSNYGSWVDVAAPGVSILSTVPNHRNSLGVYNYAYLSGTSMAAPFVAGLAALLQASSGITNQQVVSAIYDNADKINQIGEYWQHGRINALRSVKSVYSGVIVSSPSPTPTATATSTPSPTATPTLTPTPTPTSVPTNTPTPTTTFTNSPTPSPVPTGTGPTPTPWWCRYRPRWCL